MSVVLDRYKIFYGAVPKAGCTSLKLAFFRLENDFDFVPYSTNGRMRYIHGAGYDTWQRKAYPEGRIADYFRMAVVRDPLERFVSAYNNRVLQQLELSEDFVGDALKKYDLAPTPDLSLFIDRFDDYKNVHPTIWHHTRPLTDYLGHDPGYFSRVYRLSEMDRFRTDVEERTGKSFPIGHDQTGSKTYSVKDLTWRQKRKLMRLYQPDYTAFGSYF